MPRIVTACAIGLALAALAAGGCQTPASLKITPEEVVLDGAGTAQKIQVTVLDEEGNPMEEAVDIVFFSTDQEHFKLDTTNGEVTAQASGEGYVEVEVVGTDIKTEVPVRVKIAGSINVSHPQKRLRLWTGQVKDDVWSEVYSEKGATIIGFKPEWSTEDPTVVTVEPVFPERRQSWVKLVGKKSGKTNIFTCFRGMCETIVINVYDEDEEVDLAGNRIAKEAKEKAEKEKKRREKNTKKMKF
jgi:hypothetical protein